MLLRLHPVESGLVSPSSGPQIQAAFLDMVRQGDPALADWLHAPNQRRPYALGLLQGFNHIPATQLEEMRAKNQQAQVTPGQVYWLRITMLDATVFGSFAQCLLSKSRSLTVRIGDARFEISRLLSTPEPGSTTQSWVAYSSFAELRTASPAQKHYHFEFATPTAFSKGQQSWGKMLKLFPEPTYVFESLARQWEVFAPAPWRITTNGLSARDIATWCEEHIIVTRYSLETNYLPSSKFGQSGFQPNGEKGISRLRGYSVLDFLKVTRKTVSALRKEREWRLNSPDEPHISPGGSMDEESSLSADTRTNEELLHIALTAADEEVAWRAIAALHLRGGCNSSYTLVLTQPC